MNQKIKKQLRNNYLNILKTVDSGQKKQWDKNIFQKFINSKYFKNYYVFALYFSLPYEVDTIKIIKFLLENNKKVALPRMKNQTLEFYYISSFSDLIIDNQWDIYQPKESNELANIKDLDLIILPLVGFNQNCYRLGHGKGYYDYFLSSSDFKAFKLVLAYKIQEISSSIIFNDSWDIKFDAIITD